MYLYPYGYRQRPGGDYSGRRRHRAEPAGLLGDQSGSGHLARPAARTRRSGGLTTVYRVLHTLVAAGKADMVRTARGEMLYGALQSGTPLSAHLPELRPGQGDHQPAVQQWISQLAASYGYRDISHELLRAASEAVFSCLLCRACEENCPAGVHITENVRLLRRWLLEEGR
jgi:Fe2+ or Zn2+ uptake regulation protein